MAPVLPRIHSKVGTPGLLRFSVSHRLQLGFVVPQQTLLSTIIFFMSTLLQGISIDNTFGACLIGAQISAMLYGLTILQAYFYFVSYPEDSREYKALVYIIWFLDSVQTAFVTISMYHYLITNYDNPPSLAIVHWSLIVERGLNILIACTVQIFFAIQIFRLTSSRVRRWLTPIIGISIVTHFCFGIETLVLIYIKKEFSKLSEISLFAATPWAIFTVLSDLLIAGSLCVLLHGSRTGFRKTNTILTTLIIYAINRCLLTSLVAVLEVIVFSIMPNSLWYLGVDFIIGKLYANSLLAHLNSRQAISRAANTSPINNTNSIGIAIGERVDLASNSWPQTDTAGTIALEIRAVELDSRSSETQSHPSAKHKMSTLLPRSTV